MNGPLHCQVIYMFKRELFLLFVNSIFGVLSTAKGNCVTADTGNDEILNQIYVPVIPHSTCSRREYYGGWVKENTMICAGYAQGGKDSCQVKSVNCSVQRWTSKKFVNVYLFFILLMSK